MKITNTTCFKFENYTGNENGLIKYLRKNNKSFLNKWNKFSNTEKLQFVNKDYSFEDLQLNETTKTAYKQISNKEI
jgi:hypothetical protein